MKQVGLLPPEPDSPESHYTAPMSLQFQVIPVTPATPDGVPRLQAIGRETFVQTFAHNNDPHELGRYVAEAFAAEQVQAELANPDSFFYLLTDAAGTDLGYLKVNLAPAFTEAVDLENALEVQRIYLLRAAQGQGAGRLLMDQALAVAREHGLSHLWLGVWEHNLGALEFYRRSGFAAFGRHTFMFGDEAQTDVLMRRELSSQE